MNTIVTLSIPASQGFNHFFITAKFSTSKEVICYILYAILYLTFLLRFTNSTGSR